MPAISQVIGLATMLGSVPKAIPKWNRRSSGNADTPGAPLQRCRRHVAVRIAPYLAGRSTAVAAFASTKMPPVVSFWSASAAF